MPCFNLSSWSSVQPTKIDACSSSLSITVYGNSLSLGESLYSDPSCGAIYELTTGFYSNGVIAFYYLGGFRYFTSCNCSDSYCINGTTTYDDTYTVSGTFNNEVYFQSQSLSYYIYYSLTNFQWCLSSSLGGSCNLWGPFGSSSQCPDLSSTFISDGDCPTPISNPCDLFDFEAVFDCFLIPPDPDPPTPTPTNTPPPTPTPTNPCGGFYASISGTTVSSSPTPTPTLTPTPSPQVTRPCSFSGSATFNGLSERIICGDSKKFTDCFTGYDYFTTQPLLDPFSEQLLEGFVYEVIINGEKICAIYNGLVQNISGIDNLEITGVVGNSSEGACFNCFPVSPTPVYNCLVVHSECATGGSILVNPGTIINGKPSYTFSFSTNPNFSSYTYNIYWDITNLQWIVKDSLTNIAGSYLNLDTPTPVGSVSEWISLPLSQPSLNCINSLSSGFFTTELTVPCPSPTQTPTPTPTPTPNLCVTSTYLFTNPINISQEVTLQDCEGNEINTLANSGDTYFCSSSFPIYSCQICSVTLVSNDCNQNCCDVFYPLPHIGSSTVINNVTLTSSGFGDINYLGQSTFTPACYTNPITVTDIIQAGSQMLGGWSYTINFNFPVNNVRIRLIDYSFQINLNNGLLVAYESVQFSTNLFSMPTIVACEACCYKIVGNTVEAFNSIDCTFSPSISIHSGTGIFIISNVLPFTSLTISSTQLISQLGGVKFDLCGFDIVG